MTVPTAPRAPTALHRSCDPLVQAHPGQSGVFPLRAGLDAFAARVLLADAAEHTLDLQYYIWHRDLSGTLLLEALHRAADRGVRVRLLLDDNNTSGLDDVIAAFDAHPNIEVRLFNAFHWRRWRLLAYATDFARLNRRMHNKSFTADGQTTIIGGRNIGDEYFDAGHELSFIDLDVLAVGPIVADVTTDFERYWHSASATPASELLGAAPEFAASVERDPRSAKYIKAVADAPFVRELISGALELEWCTVHMVSDDPAKALGRAKESELLWTRLRAMMGPPRSELLLVTPYFVPGRERVRDLKQIARSGVRISILTNALEATDVPAVHAGYAKWRKPLLAAGIELFELKRSAGGPSARRPGKVMGSSSSSLHAKTFAVDRTRAFIGSFNFDPRSARLNTEMGFVIDSPKLAEGIAEVFEDQIPQLAYRVQLNGSGLQWTSDVQRVTTEPGTTLGKRLAVGVLGLLPIEWLL